MARDLFLREKEHAEARRLRLGAWAKKHGVSATRKGVPVNSDDFSEKVLGRRATRLGDWGVGFIGSRFPFLLGYHLIAIYHGGEA